MTTTSNPNKALWEKGDFTRIAQSMRESGEGLVERIGVKKGQKILDLGCGDGTTAIPAARLIAARLRSDRAYGRLSPSSSALVLKSSAQPR